MPAIEFRNVFKRYPHGAGRRLLRRIFHDWITPKPHDVFYALRGVSFSVEPGTGVGVIGSNGAGKSTLLSLASRLCLPDEGEVIVAGRVSAVLELGSGFHGDLTGAENLRLNASLLGMSRSRTERLFRQIVEFSGLEEFIDEPLRTYSSGMVMRLAFAVAVSMDPDILVLDEVIAVGDEAFQVKCHEKMQEFRRARKTILCASHSPQIVRNLCDRAVWLDHGRIIMDGRVDDVLAAYSGKAAAWPA